MPLRILLRSGVYHCNGTVGPAGRRKLIRRSLHTSDKDTAARQAAEIESAYWKGHFDGPGAILTFNRACDLYLAGGGSPRFLVKIDEETGKKIADEPVKAHFNSWLVKDIKPGNVKTMANELFGHCAGSSKNRLAITPVQSVINYCAEELELCDPIKVKRFEIVKREKPAATLAWVKAFQAESGPHLGAFALFMFLTGARPSEALAIERADDLDLKAATATIRETKVSKERKAHLPALLVATLANLPDVPKRPLFVYQHYDDVKPTWDSVWKRAKLSRLTPGGCRHGFATELLRRGVDVVTVAWLGGWASPAQVLATYGHALKKRDLTNVLADTILTQAVEDVASNARKVVGI